MRAIRPTSSGPALDADAPAPEPRAGWAVVEPILVGLDRADALAAKRDAGPVLGHRFVGRVRSIGPDVPEQLEGERVVAMPDVACGSCDLCTRGLRAHCRNALSLGLRELDGCLAERCSLPAANLRVVPKHVSDENAVITLHVAAACHAAQVLRMEKLTYITVIGDTALGLVAGQTLLSLNASVRVLGAGPERGTLCEKWGLRHRPSPEVGRRADQDAVIETTGTPEGLSLALALVRPRGTVILLEPTADYGPGVSLAPVVAGGVRLIGARGFAIDEAVNLIAEGRVDGEGLTMARPVPLERAPEALAAAADPEALGLAVRF